MVCLPSDLVDLLSTPTADAEDIYTLGLRFETGDNLPCDPDCAVRCYQRARELGNHNACYALARCYQQGQGVPQDSRQAYQLLQEAAAQEQKQAPNMLGQGWELGWWGEKDMQKAVSWYRTGVQLHDPDAMYNLAICLREGKGTVQDTPAARQLLQQAAERGHADAANLLGLGYEKGWWGAPDPRQALPWYEQAAARDHPAALYNLATCYLDAKGVAEDKAKALRLLQRGTRLEDGDIFNLLGRGYAEGWWGRQDMEQAAFYYRQASERQIPSAMYNLALCHLHGRGVAKSRQRACTLLQRAAALGDTDALNLLGQGYEKGWFAPADRKAALRCYLQAAEQGNSTAMCNAASCYMAGIQGISQPDKAVFWLKKAHACGSSAALYPLACHYFRGTGVEQNLQYALHLLQQAAEEQQAQALLILGQGYEEGWWGTQDMALAARYYRQAARQGLPEALYRLGRCYLSARGCPFDIPRAVSLFQAAVRRGHAGAMYTLSFHYQEGKGVKKDIFQTVRLLEQAAHRHYPIALTRLGIGYEMGWWGVKDMELAAACYQQAAEQNQTDAMYNLALCHLTGEGVEKDPARAFALLHRAGELGDEDALFMLADGYEKGRWGLPNIPMAMHYYSEAAALGNEDGETAFQRLATQQQRQSGWKFWH